MRCLRLFFPQEAQRAVFPFEPGGGSGTVKPYPLTLWEGQNR